MTHNRFAPHQIEIVEEGAYIYKFVLLHFVVGAVFYYWGDLFMALWNLGSIAILSVLAFFYHKRNDLHALTQTFLGIDAMILIMLALLRVGLGYGFEIALLFLGTPFSFAQHDYSKRASDFYTVCRFGGVAYFVLFEILFQCKIVSPVYTPDGRGAILTASAIAILLVTADYSFIQKIHQYDADHMKEAYTDEMTGLENTRAYDYYIENMKEVLNHPHFTFVAMDVNGLHSINQTYGDESGDYLIRQAAGIISKIMLPYGRVYRIGGDSFVALILADNDEIASIRKNFETELENCVTDDGAKLEIAVGYALRKNHIGASIQELERVAEQNMYRDKAKHYTKGRQVEKRRRMNLSEEEE